MTAHLALVPSATVSPERDSLRAPGSITCAYCGRVVARTDAELADVPWPEVGPVCSDMCSMIRRHNTPEWGGA